MLTWQEEKLYKDQFEHAFALEVREDGLQERGDAGLSLKQMTF
jgi:hypothetical protein